MDNNHGWIALHRKIREHPFWREHRVFSRHEAWEDILMSARWKEDEEQFVIGSRVITCGRGQVCYSLSTWSRRWNWTKSATRRFFVLLEKLGQIDTENVTKTTRVSILNYEAYQNVRINSEPEVNPTRNASETHVTPKEQGNKEKTGKNVKKTPEGRIGEDSKDQAKSPSGKLAYSEGFLKFWFAYPAPQRKEKKNCFAAWKRCGLEAKSADVLAVIEAFKVCRKWQDGYIDSTIKFFNNDMWATTPAAVNGLAKPRGRGADSNEAVAMAILEKPTDEQGKEPPLFANESNPF